MDDYRRPPEHHDWIYIIIFIGFVFAFIGIWFYSKKANEELQKGQINTQNPIIDNINSEKKLEDVIKKYNSIGTIDDTQLDY